MKRTLFPILMTSRRTPSARAEGSIQPQWRPCNHNTEICPWLAAVRGQILCLKTEMICFCLIAILVSVATRLS